MKSDIPDYFDFKGNPPGLLAYHRKLTKKKQEIFERLFYGCPERGDPESLDGINHTLGNISHWLNIIESKQPKNHDQ